MFPLVAMCASRLRNCAFAERNRIGDAHKKRGSHRPRGALRWAVLATQAVMKARARAQGLFQLSGLCLRFLQDGDVGVGAFPEGEEILIGGAGFRRVPLPGVSTCQAQPGQRTPGKVRHQSSGLDEFLKFRCRSITVVEHEVGFPTQVSGAKEYRELRYFTKLDRARRLQ